MMHRFRDANTPCLRCGAWLDEWDVSCVPIIYLTNSAVMPSGCYGTYRYRPATLDDLQGVLRGEYVSAIGYPQTVDLIERWTGVRPPLSRVEINFQHGDKALVMRLKSYVPNPATKGAPVSEDPSDWEFAWVEYNYWAL